MATPWFEGYAIDACGKLLPPIKTNKDPYGITTHGDGVIYINPTTKSAAGKNATLGKFASAVGMLLNASELEVPGGRLYQTGDTCEGKPGEVFVETWGSPAEPVQDGYLQTQEGLHGRAGRTPVTLTASPASASKTTSWSPSPSCRRRPSTARPTSCSRPRR